MTRSSRKRSYYILDTDDSTEKKNKIKKLDNDEDSSDEEPLQRGYSERMYQSAVMDTLQEALRQSTECLHLRHKGDHANAQKAILEATRLVSCSAKTLAAARRYWYPHTSVTLSDDDLHHVFRYLGTLDLLACSAVNRQWRAVLFSRSSLWSGTVQLSGSVDEIIQQWSRLSQRLVKELPIHTLSINHSKAASPAHYYQALQLSKLWTSHFTNLFPFEKVQEIHYEGYHSAIDSIFWNAIGSCKSLIHLDFTSKEVHELQYPYQFNSFKRDESIINCELREIKINVDAGINFGWLKLSQVEKLHINTTIEADDVRWNIKQAAGSLIELRICEIDHPEDRSDDSRWDDHDPDIHADPPDRSITYEEDDAIVMPNLIKFEAMSRNGRKNECQEEDEIDMAGITRVNYHLEAPNLEEMTYRGFLGWDAMLFASCCDTLKQVYFEVYDHNASVIFQGIKSLRSCRKMTLKLSCYVPPYTGHTDKEYPWALKGKSSEGHSLSNLLPNLISLTFIQDGLISGPELIHFVEEKKKESSVGQEIEYLSLQVCCNFTKEHREKLKSLVSRFHYSMNEK